MRNRENWLAWKREYSKKYYRTHKEQYKEAAKRYSLTHKEQKRGAERQRRAVLKGIVLGHYSNGKPKCARCKNTDIRVLSIDHINGKGKEHRKAIGGAHNFYAWLKANDYPRGLQVLCMNCQWIKRVEKRETSLLP